MKWDLFCINRSEVLFIKIYKLLTCIFFNKWKPCVPLLLSPCLTIFFLSWRFLGNSHQSVWITNEDTNYRSCTNNIITVYRCYRSLISQQCLLTSWWRENTPQHRLTSAPYRELTVGWGGGTSVKLAFEMHRQYHLKRQASPPSKGCLTQKHCVCIWKDTQACLARTVGSLNCSRLNLKKLPLAGVGHKHPWGRSARIEALEQWR